MSNATVINIDEGKEITSSIAMTLTLVSFSMLFLAMLMGYAVFRANAVQWPPMGLDKLDLAIPTASTLIIALSSASYIFFERSAFFGRANKSLLWVTVLTGAGFLGIQTYFWSTLKQSGFLASSGIFQSLVYAFTWTHAGHIVLAFMLLVLMLYKLDKFNSVDKKLLWVRNVGKFWHFLGVIWLIIYITVFIV